MRQPALLPRPLRCAALYGLRLACHTHPSKRIEQEKLFGKMAGLPFKVKSVYEYTSEHDDDLTFPIGQVITVVELEGDDWYVGEYTDASGAKREGLFPTNFVEKFEPEVPVRPSRPARAKQEPAPPAQPVPAPEPTAEESEAEEEAPPLPAASKPAPPPVEFCRQPALQQRR